MSISIIFSAISAISSALKISEYVEQHGFLPAGEDLIRLNLAIAEERPILQRAAATLNGAVGDAEDELFKDTEKRVAECIRKMNRALDDPDELPDDKRRYGVGGRKCICRTVGAIRDLTGGSLPADLDTIWEKYKCSEVYSLQPLMMR